MESVTHVEDVSKSPASNSGITAVPPQEDSNNGTAFSKVDGGEIKNEGSVTAAAAAASNSHSCSSNDKKAEAADEDEEGFLSGEGGSGDDIVEKPMGARDEEAGGSPDGKPLSGFASERAQVPIKLSADGDADDNNHNHTEEVVGGEGGVGEGEAGAPTSAAVPSVPKVLALRVEGVEDERDVFETAVAASRYEGTKFDELVSETGILIENGNKDSGSLGDTGEVEDPKCEAVSNQLSSVTQDPEGVKASDVKFTDKGDSIVNSIHVDLGEAVRTSVAVVGDVDGSQELEPVKPDENSVVGDSVCNQPEESVVEAVKFDDKGDAIVDSIHVNVAEVVRSGIAVVDQAGEIKDSEVEEAKSESPSGQVSFMKEESAVEKPEAFEANGIKSPDEGESAEEMNHIASDEIAESYVAVVGDADERNGSEPGKQAVISAAEESASDKPDAGDVDDVKVNDNGDAIVDSIHVDLTEVARSGAVVIDVAYETNDSGVEEAANSTVENALPGDSGFVEVDGVKYTNEGDSVVESIKVDPVEVIRSRVAVVGESVELKDSDKGESNVTFDKREKTEEDSTKRSAESMSAKDDGIIVEDAAFYDAPTEDDSVKASIDNAVDREEIKQVVQEDESHSSDLQSGEQIKDLILESRAESKVDEKIQDKVSDAEGSTDGESDNFIFGSSARARQFIQELEQASQSGALHGAGSSQETSQEVDGQIVTDSEEEADSEDDQDGKELFDSAALAALLKAASNANVDPSNVTVTSQDGSRLFSIDRPAGLGTSLRSVRPQARPTNSSLFNPTSATGPSEENLSEEEKKKLEKIQELRVKFLRLVQRLGHSAEDSIATQVLYRLALLAGRPPFPSFSLEAAKQRARKLEEEGKEDLTFSLNILVLGKSGVGKSSTINSIFGEEKVKIETFEPGTTSVNEICGVVSGVNIRVFDTPGLRSSALEQGFNQKVLASVKKFTKKNPPDIVLYVDRLDAQTRDLNDLPLLRTISSSLGSSIWRNAIVTLTHGACAPPDGPSGSPLSYEVFVAQRSHIIQQYIGQSVGDLRLMNPSLGNPVSLVENHLACRRNRDGQKVLPNGQAWRPQLLLYCFSVKILSEATSASKTQDPFDHRKLFGFRSRAPPLPYLLSSLLQPRTHPKLSADQAAESVDSDIDLDDLSDSDQEAEEDEYDQLPPFKPLRKAQLAQLSKEQKKAYFEEYDYRAKLLQKKQWKEELRRMREMKKGGKVEGDENGVKGEDFDPENGAPAPVPVPLPDMALPPTFDGDNPAFRYRFLEPSNQFLARPVLDTHGWDHDCGYDGVNLELSQDIVSRFPGNVTVQVTKDKKEFNLHLDSSVAAKHGDKGSTMAGFDIQNVGKQLAYIVRGETKFKNLKKNKTGAGVSVTFLGENIATGVKVEEQLTLGKRLVLVGSGGTVRSQKDAAYGANLEVRLREPDYPIGQDQSSFVLSLMKWRGDLAVGGNLQSQISIGRNSKLAVRMALNNKMSGQITVKTSSSDNLSLALTGLLPIILSLYRTIKAGASDGSSLYF